MDILRIEACAPPAEEVRRLLSGTHPDPHAVLGAHADGDGTMVVRALRPGADAVRVRLADGRSLALAEVDGSGLFSARVPAGEYRLETHIGGRVEVTGDGYRLPPALGQEDLRLFGAGRHPRLWEVLGAHRRDGAVSFAVWAPNALGVRVRGDFNGWHGRANPLRRLGGSGVWEVSVPDVPDGSRYRFEVLGPDGRWREKADPMASATERPPANASVVYTARHRWDDDAWLAQRARTDWTRAPMSVYEVHLGSWSPRSGGYRELAHRLVDYVRRMAFTHVQLMPLAEYPFGGSWGYQVSSYYAPTARFGTPDELRQLVETLHAAGIGVFMDFVPAHFPMDAWSLGRFDGTPLYEHPDPRRGEHPDWGTYVFDFGRDEVRNFLVSAALYWLAEFHFDGLRVDAVSSMLYLDYSRGDGEWLPNVHGGRENLDAIRFLRELTGAVHARHPGALVIAEESTAWPGVTAADGLGFDLKWNMGWMHDTLDYFGHDPLWRAGRHDRLTFSTVYAWDERFMLPLSHDEVVHGKGSLWQRMPGAPPAKAAGLRALLAHMWAHPGKQLLFMGGELGQPTEWDADGHLPWRLVHDRHGVPYHRGIQNLVRELNERYRSVPALHSLDCSPEGFEWVVADDAQNNVVAFLRHGDDGATLACVGNFSGVRHRGYRIGLPRAGDWRVVLDTDRSEYGGQGAASVESVVAQDIPWDRWPASVALDLPASTVLWLVHDSSNLPK